MKCKNWPIGVCSWSLQTDIPGVAKAMEEIGVEHVQLAIRPAVEETGTDYLDAIKAQKWTISGTMIDFPQEDYTTFETIKATGGIVPDDSWPHNRDLFIGAVEVTAKLGLKYLTTHAGFIDETDEAHAEKIRDRIRTLADAAQEKGVIFLMETGQESAADLAHFLKKLNHPAVAVNYDPANIILYDKGDPIESVRTLAPYIRHLHIKDAIRTKTPGTWGDEVPWGEGQVGPEKFLAVLEEIGFEGTMCVEREAGDNRIGDIKQAVQRLAAAG